MVKKTFFIPLATLIFSVIFDSYLVAGEFSASVSSAQVHVRENFSLNLTLKDASPKQAPSISALKKHFLIHSQQNSKNTYIFNGKASSSITWKLSLTPQAEGVVQIPSITVDTEEGPLSTQPITLTIVKGAPLQSSEESAGLNITTKLSNASPYKNEPLVYTVSLTSKKPLYNVRTQKIQIENAIVELLEDPKIEEKVIDGVLLNLVEFTHLITPLKTGSLTILPIAIQGAIPKKRKGQFSSFSNDDFDPFAMIQGFDRLKPFTVTTEEMQLDVQPAISEMSPWLPAKAITLEEQWPDKQTLRVGEPFSRKLLIKTEGLKASQLPSFEDLQSQSGIFKVYANAPEEQEKIVQNSIHSMRTEQYTIIPQQVGTWEFPEISIHWWDSSKKEKRTTTLPARSVQIQPSLGTTTPIAYGTETSTIATTTEAPSSSVRPPLMLYSIIGILILFLAAALIWGFTLQKKTGETDQTPKEKPTAKKSKKIIKPSLKTVKNKKEENLPDLNPT